MGKSGLFDLEKHYAFYGAYHNNPINILIHTICVWPVFFTALVLFYFTPTICELFGLQPQCFLARNGLFLNVGFFFTLAFAIFYICLDKKAGFLAASLCLICWVEASWLARDLGFSLAWKVVLAIQVLCWSCQIFIGHGLFEKRAPALLDNLIQAILVAPFFVLLGVLHKMFGYEPYPGFHVNVKQRIENEINQWQEKKLKKKI